MQLTKTEYSKELLEKWRNEEVTESKITGLLTQYIHSYDTVITNKTQRIHFENYLRGLMSNLDRKSIEPIALSITGEKGVRPLQQFVTRSTFNDERVLDKYRGLIGTAIKYFLSNAPDTVDIAELHEAATLRWPIEQCFEECKSYLGMDHFEGRSYSGFLRHLLFVMIAHFFVTSLRLELKKTVYQ